MELCVDDSLVCPMCKELWLHMESVKVFFDEKGEDGKKIKTAVTRAETAVTRCSGDPDDVGRRDLLVIEFSCEQCHGLSYDEEGNEVKSKIPYHKLRLQQHKGVTLVEWN